MFNRIHQKLGTAGFIISIVALVAALGGGAYAASGGLNGKQKKEVEKIAKKYAGKPGAAGATGPAGAPGAKGEAGAAGAAGSDGAAGTSVTSKAIPTSSATCNHHGGSEFTSAGGTTTTACNGEQGEPGETGSPWSEGGTLPSEATETGTYFAGAEGNGSIFGGVMKEISFPVPLEAPIASGAVVYYDGQGSVPADCENPEHAGSATALNPEAKPGFLCVFQNIGSDFKFEEASTTAGPEVGPAGTFLLFSLEGSSAAERYVGGTWAVTAP